MQSGTQRETNKKNMRNKQKMRLKRGVSVLITEKAKLILQIDQLGWVPTVDLGYSNTEVCGNLTRSVLAKKKKKQKLNNGMASSIHLPMATLWYNTHWNYSWSEWWEKHYLASEVDSLRKRADRLHPNEDHQSHWEKRCCPGASCLWKPCHSNVKTGPGEWGVWPGKAPEASFNSAC